MKNFPFDILLRVRFRDLDPMGHVNNAVYATYFEIGRAAFFHEVFGVEDVTGFDFILAGLEINYRRPIRMADEVALGLRVGAVGRTSFVFEYALEANGLLAAEGKTVQVSFDYVSHTKKELEGAFRAKLEEYRNGEADRC